MNKLLLLLALITLSLIQSNAQICSANCQSCGTNGAGKCDTCKTGYFKTADNTCTACEANCDTCTDATTCTACSTKYFDNSGTCTACEANCDTCTDATTCTACTTGFFDNSGTCTACPANCNTCTDANTCTACKGGYFVNAGACTACSAGCTACTSATACTACGSGYTLASAACSNPVTTASPVAASFASTPAQVINSTDTKWYNALTKDGAQFGAGTDNTTILYYQVTTSGSGPYTSVINRRSINASTLATITDLTAVTGPSMASTSYVAAAGQGTFGVLSTLTASGNSVADVQISVVAESATSVTSKLLTAIAATDVSFSFVPNKLWYDEVAGLWYAVWTKYDTGFSPVATYIGGLNVTNGSNTVLYQAGGVSILTYGTLGGSVSDVSPNNVSNSSTATFIYTQTPTGGKNTVYSSQITLATGAATSGTALLANADTAGAADVAEAHTTQSFVGHINSKSTFGTAVLTTIQTCPTKGVNICSAPGTTAYSVTKTVYVFFNNTSPSTYNYTVTSTDTSSGVSGIHYGDGYSLIYHTTSSAGSRTFSYMNYFKNGTVNGTTTATSLGTFNGIPSSFIDANGAFWLGWTNYAQGSKLINDASLGKVFGQVFLFGNVISSVFALITMIVAALFVF